MIGNEGNFTVGINPVTLFSTKDNPRLPIKREHPLDPFSKRL